MNPIIADILVTLLAFTAMEGVAWTAHKYLMHGWLWGLHRDHHKREYRGFFERNDYFFLIFALPGILCLFVGVIGQFDRWFWAGLGITMYGMAYFVVHDIFIHQRFKLFRHTNNRYLRAIRRAHKMHHKHLGKEDGECFGMLWVPLRYFRAKKEVIP